jgi:IS30 family transposase
MEQLSKQTKTIYRWLYNHDNSTDHENWQTPELVRIKNKKSKKKKVGNFYSTVAISTSIVSITSLGCSSNCYTPWIN